MKNIKIMVVDDEKFALEDFISMVEWEKFGYKICATAFNGKQALKKFKELKPDLIFTDMSMPIMDGVEMIKNIRKENCEVEIIVLSAYEDFSYAKTAIKYGIQDYILKSEITQDLIISILNKIKLKLDDKFNKNFLIKKNIINKYFSNSLESEIENEQLLSQKFYCFIFQQRLPLNICGDVIFDDITCSSTLVENIIKKLYFDNFNTVTVASVANNKFLILLTNKNNVYINDSIIKNTAEDIVNQITKLSEYKWFVFYFNKPVSVTYIKKFYNSSKQIFKYKYFNSNLSYCDILNIETCKPKLHRNFNISELCDNDELSINEFNQKIENMFNQAIEDHNFERLYIMSKSIYKWLLNMISVNKNSCNVEWIDNYQNWIAFDKILSWFQTIYLSIQDLKLDSCGGYSSIVNSIIKYINENYYNPSLSLNDIAEHVNISCGYLCFIFKIETKMTVKSYISEVRIAKAKVLLKKSNFKIYQVSKEVGFISSQYFSQVFYKKTGVFPHQYK